MLRLLVHSWIDIDRRIKCTKECEACMVLPILPALTGYMEAILIVVNNILFSATSTRLEELLLLSF